MGRCTVFLFLTVWKSDVLTSQMSKKESEKVKVHTGASQRLPPVCSSQQCSVFFSLQREKQHNASNAKFTRRHKEFTIVVSLPHFLCAAAVVAINPLGVWGPPSPYVICITPNGVLIGYQLGRRSVSVAQDTLSTHC